MPLGNLLKACAPFFCQRGPQLLRATAGPSLHAMYMYISYQAIIGTEYS